MTAFMVVCIGLWYLSGLRVGSLYGTVLIRRQFLLNTLIHPIHLEQPSNGNDHRLLYGNPLLSATIDLYRDSEAADLNVCK